MEINTVAELKKFLEQVPDDYVIRLEGPNDFFSVGIFVTINSKEKTVYVESNQE